MEIIKATRLCFLLMNLLKNLDSEIRITVYIGTTGIIIAIVIFIVELTSNQKHETYKKLLISTTKIQYQIIFMIGILGLIWLGSLIEKPTYLYYIFQLMINVFIILSMYFILKIFSLSLKLNTDELYLNNKLDKYIQKTTKKFNKVRVKRLKKDSELKEEFNIYLAKNSNCFSNDYFFNTNEKYIPIYPTNDGYISKINYNYLNTIVEDSLIQLEADDSNITKAEMFDDIGNKKEPKVYFCTNVGEKVNKNFPIAYYKDLKKSSANNINKIFSLDIKMMYILDNLVKIIDNLFDIACENKENFDNNNRILNYYKYLCEINNIEVIGIFFNKVRNVYIESIKHDMFCASYINFLYRLSFISADKNRYAEFETLNSYIISGYYHIIKENIKNDYKQIAYDYANEIFSRQQYYYSQNKDSSYYDCIMGNLLKIISFFLRIKEIDAILVLLDNINFSKSNIDGNNYNDKDIVNFQFLLGIVYLILYNYNTFELSENFDFINIKKIIEKINYTFFSYFDVWEFIVNFKLYKDKKTYVQKTYRDLEFDRDSDEYKYKNSIISWTMNDIEVLKCMMYMFNINYSVRKPQEEEIDRRDIYYYNNIKKKIETTSYIKLEKIFNFKSFAIDKVKEIVSQAIDIAEKKEIEYKKNNELDDKKMQLFKDIILRESKKAPELMSFVEIIKINKKQKKAFGINQLIPRELFFDDIGGVESFASDFGKAITRGINRELYKKLEAIPAIIVNSLSEGLKKIKTEEDILIITNSINYKQKELEQYLSSVKINNKVYFLRTNKLENILIIYKKNLPLIELFQLDDEYDNKYIKNGVFIELRDLSTDVSASVREEIITNSAWLQEKGNKEEQIEYLKQQCNLRAFLSFKIRVNPNAAAIVIKLDKE